MNNYKQSGSVLIMALILLMVITLLGISSMRGSNLDARISSNHAHKNFSFQAADNALVRAINDSAGAIIPVSVDAGDSRSLSDYYSYDLSAAGDDDRYASSLTMSADLQVTFQGIQEGCLIHGFGLGKNCFVYDIDATGEVNGSGASTTNRVGAVLFRE